MKTTTKQLCPTSANLKTAGGQGVNASVDIDDAASLLEAMECRKDVWKRLQKRFAHIPPEKSLADELIAEHRADAEGK